MSGVALLRALVPLVLTATSACSLAQLAAGQLELINGQRRLDRAIARERDPSRRALLREVPSIRRFGEQTVGLHPGQTYTGYYETERKALTFVVTACEKLRFEPYSWWFPVAGRVEYRSYWDEADALEEAAELERQGYDTWVGGSRAYSTLGFFRDPVITTMMRNGPIAFVETLIHEMAHVRLYVPGQTDWNEALASFVGERGAELYFARPRFAGTALQAFAAARRGRRQLLEHSIDRTLSALERLYASRASAAAKLRERERHFAALSRELQASYPEEPPDTWRVNNARLVHFRRYSANNALLLELWRASGSDFRRFWPLAERHSETLN